MQDFLFRMPRQIDVGFGKSRTLAAVVNNLGLKRLLLVVDPNVRKAGIIDHILDDLPGHGITLTIFDEIAHEPTVAEIDDAIERLQVGTACDGVIGIGGGSTIDAAKACVHRVYSWSHVNSFQAA
jgi:alcohol dehydrogenase class IV